jgi:hypothetical protein
VGKAKGRRPAVEGSEVVISLEGGVGSLSATSPPFTKVIFDGLAMSTLSFREEDSDLGEDFFVWPHPTDPGKALFMVDDAFERAAGEAASQSREGVQETLSKLDDAIAVVAQLGTEAQCQMADEVVVQV